MEKFEVSIKASPLKLAPILVLALVSLGSCFAQSNQNVTDSHINYSETEDNSLFIGQKSSYETYFFINIGEPMILVEIIEKSREADASDIFQERASFGKLKILQRFNIESRYPKIEKIEFVTTNCLDGLKKGDQVILILAESDNSLFFPHLIGQEGCIGYRIQGGNKEHGTSLISFALDYISKGRSEPTNSDLRTWAKLDPRGVSEYLIRERELLGTK